MTNKHAKSKNRLRYSQIQKKKLANDKRKAKDQYDEQGRTVTQKIYPK